MNTTVRRRLTHAVFGVCLTVLCLAGPLLTGPASAATKIPDLTSPLVDEANVVNSATAQQVRADLQSYRARSTNQISILIIDALKNTSIEDYAADVFKKWKLGTAEKDNGVLVVLAMDDHKSRIETGYGIEGELTDIEAKQILDTQIRPRLRNEDPNGAVLAGEQAIRYALGDTDVATPPTPLKPASTGFSWFWFIAFVIVVIVVGALRGNSGVGGPIWYGGGGGWGGGDSGGGWDGGGGDSGGGGASGDW